MDGANPWNEFWDMTLPQMKKVLTIVSLLSVIWAFRSFTVIWTITQGNPFYRTDVSVTYLWKVAFQNLRFGRGLCDRFRHLPGAHRVQPPLHEGLAQRGDGLMRSLTWLKWLAIIFLLDPRPVHPDLPVHRHDLDVVQDAAGGQPDTADLHPARADPRQLPGDLEHHPAGRAFPQQLPARRRRDGAGFPAGCAGGLCADALPLHGPAALHDLPAGDPDVPGRGHAAWHLPAGRHLRAGQQPGGRGRGCGRIQSGVLHLAAGRLFLWASRRRSRKPR